MHVVLYVVIAAIWAAMGWIVLFLKHRQCGGFQEMYMDWKLQEGLGFMEEYGACPPLTPAPSPSTLRRYVALQVVLHALLGPPLVLTLRNE